MLTTKNIVRSLVGLSIASGWAAAKKTCCPAASIVHAKLDDDPTWSRRLTPETACQTNRAAYISAWPVVTDEWVTQGDATFVEKEFTRYVRDFGLNAQYWKDVDGGDIAKGAKVIVIDADISPDFSNLWKSRAAAGTPAEYCSKDVTWAGEDMGAALSQNAAYFIVRAANGALADWSTWLTGDWATVATAHCGTGCRVTVQEKTGSFLDDVLAGLVAIGAAGDPFSGCDVCEHVATTPVPTTPVPTTPVPTTPTPAPTTPTPAPTTTTVPADSTTTTVAGDSTTVTVASGASHVSAGVATVGLAALALIM